MKKLKLFIGLLLLITVFAPTSLANAQTSNYTYNYDFFGVNYESPDTYTPENRVFGSDLGIGDFKNPAGMFVKDDHIFICDSGNNRIVEVDKNFTLINTIQKVLLDGKPSALKNPQDIFVTPNNDLYICDTGNNRVLHLDNNLKVVHVYTKPNDSTIKKDQAFIPLKGVVDTAGRLYLMAQNITKGFIVFDKEGNFSGYRGANKVKVSFMEVLEKRMMTKAQRARMEMFVPTEYSNIAIDKDNFLFATTETFEVPELKNGSANPVRKINSLGDDILIRNGYFKPIGEIWWDSAGDISGPSRFVDVTAMDNDTYYCLDRNRGRIFAYDFQGNLLFVFGGLGNRLGYFKYPVALDHMGTDLVVLDSKAGCVTRFRLTEFGTLISKGLAEYKAGRYDASARYWKKVNRLNGNYDMAYIGIGRALLRQERYHEAMAYFKTKNDTKNYSKAFQEYRKEWVEENIGYILAVIIALIILPKLIRFIRKVVKGEVFK